MATGRINIEASDIGTDYIRFSNGLQICWKVFSQEEVAINSPWGNLYESDLINLGAWSKQFIEEPTVTLSTSGSGAIIEQLTGVSTSQIGRVRVARATTATINLYISIIGIGRWK